MDDRRERSMLVADGRERPHHRSGRDVALDGRHEHRDRRVLQNPLRLRAEHQSLDAAVPMRRDEDQVATLLLGDIENRLVGPAARRGERCVADACLASDGFRLRQDRPRFPGHALVEVGGRDHPLQRADAGRTVVFLRVEERDLRTERARKPDRLAGRFGRQRRVIEWNHQMAVHGVVSSDRRTTSPRTACRR